MMIDRFYSNTVPKDRYGSVLKPMDLVILGDIPEHYWKDPEFSDLKEFSGCYGLITYFPANGPDHEAFYHGDPNHPGWVSGDGDTIYVLSRRIADGFVVSYDFWMPTNHITRIPFNSLIMNIFSQLPWQIAEDGATKLFVSKGLREFDYIEKLMGLPYERLVLAHAAAMSLIEVYSE
ncbi:MAG: hypothetical protein R3D51_17110 [Hyphomicrobiaceae bacterium]